MSAAIIDGKAIAAAIREEIRQEVEALEATSGHTPGLATVLVGGRRDSQTYVRMKKRACEEVGIVSFGRELPEDVSQETLLQVVADLNADPRVHGILVQLPLPGHIDDEDILGAISIEKDVDGFHPLNIGRLSMKRRDPLFVPCTPKGCIELLDRSGVVIEGRNAVVLGRSNIVGLPVAMLLLHRNATVTICHSRTADLPAVVRTADILVAAVGRAEMVRGDWLKPGATVIDVGVNAVEDASRERGYRLVGDVCYEEAQEVAGAITPVPGGVGPMTIAMLLRNTLDGARRALGKH
jgi:5,10-methylene-tetrahydrofolate dehydrogenase/methenyl tetrahydrofolate cyclohydrolase